MIVTIFNHSLAFQMVKFCCGKSFYKSTNSLCWYELFKNCIY